MQTIDYRDLFETLPGLYLILAPDSKFTIIAVSNAYAEATMTKREEILGKGLFEMFPDNPNDPVADGESNLRGSLASVMRNCDSHSMPVQKYDIRRPDGSFEERYWNPLNKPVLDEEGKVMMIIHKVEDVTEFVRLQKDQAAKDLLTEDLRTRIGQMEMEAYRHSVEINKVNARLTKTNQELESFTYSVSHDLRTPLRAIGGYARMLEEDYSRVFDDEGTRLLGNIQSNALRMGKLIDSLLTFSKLNKKELKKTNVSMQELFERIRLELLNVAGNAEIQIGRIEDAPADQELISQVIMNLMSNAIKYSSKKEKPLVKVTCNKDNGHVTYTVSDNGSGFDMQYADKLFGVFQRLHHQHEFEGTGVGLAIVKRIVDRHGGKVWAESKPGEGAAFSFTLPLSEG